MRKQLRKLYLRHRDRKDVRAVGGAVLAADGCVEMARAQTFFLSRRETPSDYYPHFLGLGAQKAATTWLDKVLRNHPALCLPAGRKEIHFFDNNRWKGWAWYAWHFRCGQDKLRGEITPAYSILSEDKLREVAAALPGLKAILILRNPLERAWSMASMDLAKHRQLDMGKIGEEQLIAHFESAPSVERGSYSKILSRWESTVGAESLFVGFYEEILDSPVDFTRRLCEFLWVDPDAIDWSNPDLLVRENTTGYSMPDSVRQHLSGLYRNEIRELDRRLRHPCTRQWVAELSAPIKGRP